MSAHAKCNLCWRELEESAYITRCSHIFCESDAKKSFSVATVCPLCDTSLQGRGGVTLVEFSTSACLEKAVQLCGLPPATVMSLATKALEFWDYQKQTELEYQKMAVKNMQLRAQKIEKYCNDQLVEAQNTAQILNQQLTSLKEENQNTKKQVIDLQQKYEERTRQKRKLAELYESLKQRCETSGSVQKTESTLFQPKDFITSSPRQINLTGRVRQSSDVLSVAHPNKSQEIDRFSLLRRPSPTPPKLAPFSFSPMRPSFPTPKRPETPLFSQHFPGVSRTPVFSSAPHNIASV